MSRQVSATYFTGLRNSGKTTLGRKYAFKNNIPFIDIDEKIENNIGLPIREVYKKYGPEGMELFQYIEIWEAIDEVIGAEGGVVSLGGGAADSRRIMELIYRTGNVIYLRAPFELLYKRLMEEKDLPPFIDRNNPEKSFRKIYNRRSRIYEKYANIIYDIDKDNFI